VNQTNKPINLRSKVPKILFLGTQIEFAGAQRVLISQARWFHEKGYAVQAVFLYDKQSLLKQWQLSNPFPVLSLEGRKPGSDPISNTIKLLGAIVKLFRLLRNGPDVIVSFTPHSNLIGLPVAWFAGVPVRIGTVHGQISGASKLLAWFHGRLVNSKIPRITVCVSEQVKRAVVKNEHANPNRLIVIENGIDLELYESGDVDRQHIRKELKVPGKGVMIISVGRLAVEKGHTYLLDAFSKVIPTHPNVFLVIVGDGPLRSQLDAQAKELVISDRMIFVGLRGDVINLLKSSEMYIQPSLSEGLSLALLEALAASLPIVATKIPGFVSILDDEKTALLVPPANSDELAIAMERLILDGSFRNRIARSGHELVKERYSVAAMCKAYERLIQKYFPNELQ
jgi:glycosyltransferase involved in cell wall biosynthesis